MLAHAHRFAHGLNIVAHLLGILWTDYVALTAQYAFVLDYLRLVVGKADCLDRNVCTYSSLCSRRASASGILAFSQHFLFKESFSVFGFKRILLAVQSKAYAVHAVAHAELTA